MQTGTLSSRKRVEFPGPPRRQASSDGCTIARNTSWLALHRPMHSWTTIFHSSAAASGGWIDRHLDAGSAQSVVDGTSDLLSTRLGLPRPLGEGPRSRARGLAGSPTGSLPDSSSPSPRHGPRAAGVARTLAVPARSSTVLTRMPVLTARFGDGEFVARDLERCGIVACRVLFTSTRRLLPSISKLWMSKPAPSPSRCDTQRMRPARSGRPAAT